MAERTGTLLEEAIESWEFARTGVIAEAEVFAEDEYDYRPGDGSRNVTELLYHLVESGLMMVGELTDPAGDFTRADPGTIYAEYAGLVPREASPAELRDLLRTTLVEGVAKFRLAGEVEMLQTIRRFDGEVWTRLAWMHHGIAHEEYHRGQLALYARLCGHVPALTQLIHGDAAE